MTFREVPHEFYEGTNDHVIRDDKQQPDTQDFTDPATSMITVSSSRDVFHTSHNCPRPTTAGMTRPMTSPSRTCWTGYAPR